MAIIFPCFTCDAVFFVLFSGEGEIAELNALLVDSGKKLLRKLLPAFLVGIILNSGFETDGMLFGELEESGVSSFIQFYSSDKFSLRNVHYNILKRRQFVKYLHTLKLYYIVRNQHKHTTEQVIHPIAA
ncbi:hypothetical protein T07_11309 [Trichinella nelsoni]|uniref:Uncharacterized protein n=1 Tax=Trichinella nelsoni TaxID=6336 RepID=A0A0V0SHH5_9BILA|nr:hypothetical protein T07_11309 [Trichinella nelsoni]